MPRITDEICDLPCAGFLHGCAAFFTNAGRNRDGSAKRNDADATGPRPVSEAMALRSRSVTGEVQGCSANTRFHCLQRLHSWGFVGKNRSPATPGQQPASRFFNHHHLMNPTTDQWLSFLAAFDVPGRSVPVGTVSAFLAVAEGCDHVSDLSARLGTAPRTTARLVKLLAGRPRWHEGAWIQSPFALVDLRPHPHRGGEQYRLSEQGLELLERLRSRPDGLLRGAGKST